MKEKYTTLLRALANSYGHDVLIAEVVQDMEALCDLNRITEPVTTRHVKRDLEAMGYTIVETGCAACGGRLKYGND